MPHTESDTESDTVDESPSPYSSLLDDMSRIHALLSEYKSHIELSQQIRVVQHSSASMGWMTRKADLFDVYMLGRSSRSIPALFLPNDELINMHAGLQRTQARELDRVTDVAGERLRTCQGLLGKVTGAINQLDEEATQNHEVKLEQEW